MASAAAANQRGGRAFRASKGWGEALSPATDSQWGQGIGSGRSRAQLSCHIFDGPVPGSRRAGRSSWFLGAGGRLEPRRAGVWFAPGPGARGGVVAVTAGPAGVAPGGCSMQQAAGA